MKLMSLLTEKSTCKMLSQEDSLKLCSHRTKSLSLEKGYETVFIRTKSLGLEGK